MEPERAPQLRSLQKSALPRAVADAELEEVPPAVWDRLQWQAFGAFFKLLEGFSTCFYVGPFTQHPKPQHKGLQRVLELRVQGLGIWDVALNYGIKVFWHLGLFRLLRDFPK